MGAGIHIVCTSLDNKVTPPATYSHTIVSYMSFFLSHTPWLAMHKYMYVNLYVAKFPIQLNNFSAIINFFVHYLITMNLLPTFLCRIMSLLCMMQSRRLNIKNSLHYRGRLQSVNNKRTMQNRRRMMSPLGKLPFLRFRSLWVVQNRKQMSYPQIPH